MVIALDDVAPDELPAYLHNKQHILWERDRPDNPDAPHPAYARIIRQLFKGSGGLRPDEAAQDSNRLLDRFLTFLYACEGQREILKIHRSKSPLIHGKIRRDLSLAAIFSGPSIPRCLISRS